jgi:hypothetical protein
LWESVVRRGEEREAVLRGEESGVAAEEEAE